MTCKSCFLKSILCNAILQKDDLSIDAASHVSSSNSDDDDDDDESDVEDLEVLVEEETNMEVADNNSDLNSFSGNLSNKSLSNRSSKTSTIVSRSSGISTTSRLSNNSRVSMKNITSTRSFYHEEVDEKSSSDNDEEVCGGSFISFLFHPHPS